MKLSLSKFVRISSLSRRFIGFSDSRFLLRKRFLVKKFNRFSNKSNSAFIYPRSLRFSSVVTNTFRNSRIAVHTGKGFFSFLIQTSMLGFRFCSHGSTCKWGPRIHLSKKNKKKAARKK